MRLGQRQLRRGHHRAGRQVKSASGKTWDAAKDFAIEQNPNGAWSYGQLRPGDKPNTATFTRFPIGRHRDGHRQHQQPRLDGLGGHPQRPAPLPARAAHRRRHPDPAHPRAATASRSGSPSTASAARWTCCAPVRRYEQAGKTEVEDAQLYRTWRDQFLADWQRYRLDEVFDRPEDFFTQCIARMAGQRLLGLNAIRANPNVIGHSLTGTLDQGMTAEGVWTTFRELKPGTTDAVFDGWAPLRWCLFVEPVNVYRKTPVKLEAVLANEDVLAPGEYPARLQVVGPNLDAGLRADDHRQDRRPARASPSRRWCMPVFAEDVVIDGPPGKYRFLATFEQGAAACGEEVQFYRGCRHRTRCRRSTPRSS